MIARLRIVFVVLALLCSTHVSAVPSTTIAAETDEPIPSPNISPCLSLLKTILGDYHTATPGPDEVLNSSTESADTKAVRSFLESMQPVLKAKNPVLSPQPIPIYINTYSDNSPVNVVKDTNGAFSIHISTKIDFGGSASLLHVPQGSVLGPLVLNNNIQFHVAEPPKAPPPKDQHHYYEYSDDEDYYMDEGSGNHRPKTSEAPTTEETTESGSTTVGV